MPMSRIRLSDATRLTISLVMGGATIFTVQKIGFGEPKYVMPLGIFVGGITEIVLRFFKKG
jgi:hypothetical protein